MHSPEKSIALLSLVLFAVQPTIGQGDPNCEQRTVIATVADARGVVQADLTSDNFKVIYKGGVTKLLHATYSKGPRRIVLLLDVSGSMSGFASGKSKKWQVAREAASELIAALPPGSKASLMTFSEKADIKSALSPDLRPIQDWLNSEAAQHPESFHGRTALYAAVQSALAQLEPTEPGDAIYVITDGGENASRVSESKLECALGSSGVRVFALIVPEEFGSFEDERGGWVELLDLSKHSGGFVEVAGLSGAASMASGSVGRLRHSIQSRYNSPRTLTNPSV